LNVQFFYIHIGIDLFANFLLYDKQGKKILIIVFFLIYM